MLSKFKWVITQSLNDNETLRVHRLPQLQAKTRISLNFPEVCKPDERLDSNSEVGKCRSDCAKSEEQFQVLVFVNLIYDWFGFTGPQNGN